MSNNKRYYWLKLNENFFEDDTIQWIEEQENGKEYVIFYLKLALRSLQDDGKLIRYVGEGLIPYDTRALAKLTNTNIDTVNTAMEAFLGIGLVERLETGELYMKQINEMIGSETEVARRVRKHRAKENALEQAKEVNLLQSNVDVTKSNTEKEKELEIDKEIDKEHSPAKAEPPIPFESIINHLNDKADRQYKHTTGKTKALIKSRWKEGFTEEDFKKVIDNKTAQWKSDKEMSKYLRPQTLFGTKFESYLNEKAVNETKHPFHRPEDDDPLPF